MINFINKLLNDFLGIQIHRSYVEAFPLEELPLVSERHFIKNKSITIVEPQGKAGSVALSEIAIINGIIKQIQPQKVFEIGTFEGRTTLNMAYNSPNNCQVFTLDLPPNKCKDEYMLKSSTPIARDRLFAKKKTVGNKFVNSSESCKTKIIQLYGDSFSFDFSPYLGTCQVVFIDGSHDYNHVLQDSKNALKLLNKGVILWHDYGPNSEVGKALKEYKKYLQSKKINFQIYNIEKTSLALLDTGLLGLDPSAINFTIMKEYNYWKNRR